MPSKFLKSRYNVFFPQVSGKENIEYFPYNDSASNLDDVTGDVISESAAYPSTGTKLSALINFSPSKAAREKVGVEIAFDAMVRLTTKNLTDSLVTPKIGDAMVLPGTTEMYYVKKIFSGKQGDTDFLDVTMAVKRGTGTRG